MYQFLTVTVRLPQTWWLKTAGSCSGSKKSKINFTGLKSRCTRATWPPEALGESTSCLLQLLILPLLLLQSCPTLCNPIDGSPPGSPVPGILQARTLEWAAISLHRNKSSNYKSTKIQHKIQHMLGYKRSLNKQKIKIVSSIFSNYSGMREEIPTRKTGKNTSTGS